MPFVLSNLHEMRTSEPVCRTKEICTFEGTKKRDLVKLHHRSAQVAKDSLLSPLRGAYHEDDMIVLVCFLSLFGSFYGTG